MALATLSIDLEAKLANLESDMGRASRIAEQHANRMEKAFAAVRAAGAAIGTALAGSLSISAFTEFVQDSAEAAAQIERLSQLAGASTGEFQRFAAGAKSVGMDMDKFSDVMKDVQDKVGDFLSTGGGELKDFFEQVAPKVGVTADQFRTLSGPQALQLFYTTLERANVGSKEMVFFLESIADDASTLAPLLRGNGEGFKKLADEAEKAGLVMSDKLIKEGVELNKNLKELQQNIDGAANSIKGVLIPAINDLFDAFKGQDSLGQKLANVLGLNNIEARFEGLKTSAQLIGLSFERALLQKSLDENPGDSLTRQRIEQIDAQARQLGERFKSARNEYLKLNNTAAGAGRGFVPRDRETPDELPISNPGSWRHTPEKKPDTEAEKYLQQLEDEAKKLAELTDLQQALQDLEKGRMEGLTPALKKRIIDQAAANDETRFAAFITEQLAAQTERLSKLPMGPELDPDVEARLKRLHELLADTPTAKIEEMRRDMQLLADEFKAGAISATQFSEAAQARLGTLPDAVDPAFQELDERFKEFGHNVQDALGSTIYSTLKGDFDSIGELWSDLLLKMASEAMAAELGNLVFGQMFKAGGGNGSTGLVGAAMSWLMSADGNAFDTSGHVAAFAAGGVFDQATAFTYGAGQLGVLGEDGPEAILPLKRGAGGKLGVMVHGGGGSSVVINPTYHIGQGVSRSEVIAAVSAANAQLKADILRSQRRGGAHSQ